MKANERIVGLYEQHASAWDRMRGRDLHEAAWLERFAQHLPDGGTLLDIGCGMGEPIARWFIARGYRVTGADSSPSLIAMCRARFPDQDWHVADMRTLALGRRFDGLLAWHSFFHLSPADQEAVIPIFAAHLHAGAPLMFTSGTDHGESIGAWMGEPLYHGSLAPDGYRALLEANAFDLLENRQRDPGCGSSTVWLALRR